MLLKTVGDWVFPENKDKLIRITGDCETLRVIIPVFVLPRRPLLCFWPYSSVSMLVHFARMCEV